MGKYICKMLQDLKVPTKGVNYLVKKEQKNCEQTGKVVHTIPINLTQYLPPSQQFTTAWKKKKHPLENKYTEKLWT